MWSESVVRTKKSFDISALLASVCSHYQFLGLTRHMREDDQHLEELWYLIAKRFYIGVRHSRGSLNLKFQYRSNPVWFRPLPSLAFIPCSSVPVHSRALLPFNNCHLFNISARISAYRWPIWGANSLWISLPSMLFSNHRRHTGIYIENRCGNIVRFRWRILRLGYISIASPQEPETSIRMFSQLNCSV